MARSPVITFRLDRQTYAQLGKLAAARGQSPGAMARELLLEGMVAAEGLSPAEVEELRGEIRELRRQLSRGVELLARLMFRTDPDARSDAEEGPASWVRRELPR